MRKARPVRLRPRRDHRPRRPYAPHPIPPPCQPDSTLPSVAASSIASTFWVDDGMEIDMTLDAIITVIDAKHLERHLSTGDTAAASTHKVPPYPPPLLRGLRLSPLVRERSC